MVRKTDHFDLIMIASLVALAVVAALLLFLDEGGETSQSPAYQAAVQKQLMRQARLDHLNTLYQPAQDALGEGRYADALLAIDEIARRYPGEPHGLMLKGEVQLAMGAVNEGLVSVTTAARLDGEYLDEESPLSRRSLLEQMVNEVLPRLREEVRDKEPTPVQLRSLKELRYLQSRLAGGCE